MAAAAVGLPRLRRPKKEAVPAAHHVATQVSAWSALQSSDCVKHSPT